MARRSARASDEEVISFDMGRHGATRVRIDIRLKIVPTPIEHPDRARRVRTRVMYTTNILTRAPQTIDRTYK